MLHKGEYMKRFFSKRWIKNVFWSKTTKTTHVSLFLILWRKFIPSFEGFAYWLQVSKNLKIRQKPGAIQEKKVCPNTFFLDSPSSLWPAAWLVSFKNVQSMWHNTQSHHCLKVLITFLDQVAEIWFNFLNPTISIFKYLYGEFRWSETLIFGRNYNFDMFWWFN